jgi:hypothetical protein
MNTEFRSSIGSATKIGEKECDGGGMLSQEERELLGAEADVESDLCFFVETKVESEVEARFLDMGSGKRLTSVT